MDVISYALSKKIAEHAVSGVQSMSVNGQTLTINTKDSGVLTMTFPTPKDGVSVTDIDVNANNQIVFTMSDGSEFISGKIPAVKGDPGFSPIITENANNTDKIYKLDITTADSTFTTPNLKGADGQGGTGGDSSITLTQEEYEALTEEQKLNGLYYIYDTKRIYKNGVQYGASEPISLTMAEYKALKEAGAIDEQQEYLIEADEQGILLDAEDIGYSNAKSGIQANTVQDAIDKIAESSGGEKNVQSDWNETDDTADGFIKNKPTIPDITGLVTETWVNEQGFLTEHQDLTDYAKKNEIPTVPSKVSELTNDSNYQTAEQVNSTVTTEIAKVVADSPEDFDTLKEMSDWIAGHEDDASAMNSAISDNKAAIASLQTGKADKSEIPTTLPADGGNSDTVNNHTVKSDVPENAVFTDTVYDDTEVKEEISSINSNLSQLEYEIYDNSKSQWADGAYTSTGDTEQWNGFHRTVNYTEVTPNTTYTISNSEKGNFSNGICYYDANKTFLSWDFYVENGKTFKTPSNCKYIRFTVESANIPTSVSIKTFNSEFLTEAVKHQNESLEQLPYNLIDLNKVVSGKKFDTSDAAWSTSDYIYVKGQRTLSVCGKKFLADNSIQFYDESKKVISTVTEQWENITNIQIPSNAVYCRITIRTYSDNNDLSTVMLCYGNVDANASYKSFNGNPLFKVSNDVDEVKNDLDKLNALPIGTIIQIETDKDTIATTEAKYSWQYLGTSNIQYENGGAYILVANVYRKNN